MIWCEGPDGVYLACNEAFEGLLGAPEAQIVGRTDHDFVDRELAATFVSRIAKRGRQCADTATVGHHRRER